MNEKQLRRAIEQLLEAQPDNQRSARQPEGLCRDPLFPGLTWFWGPRLYARSKAVFRSFILNHFSDWIASDRRWTRSSGPTTPPDLEAWLQSARAGRDGALIRRLQRWKYGAAKGWGLDLGRWNAALVEAYRAAAPRRLRGPLCSTNSTTGSSSTEPTAIRLYDTDRSSAAFILKHLPVSFWSEDKRVMWEKLGAVARAHGDEAASSPSTAS